MEPSEEDKMLMALTQQAEEDFLLAQLAAEAEREYELNKKIKTAESARGIYCIPYPSN